MLFPCSFSLRLLMFTGYFMLLLGIQSFHTRKSDETRSLSLFGHSTKEKVKFNVGARVGAGNTLLTGN